MTSLYPLRVTMKGKGHIVRTDNKWNLL